MNERAKPRPVRAWAEYEKWAVFLIPPAREFWMYTCVPKGGKGDVFQIHALYSLENAIQEIADRQFGPLRSLRVLFDTGHEMHVHRGSLHWTWGVAEDDQPPYASKGSARIDDVTDADAVQRAIDAAVEWIGAQEGGEG